jgi:putative oxidoreductase
VSFVKAFHSFVRRVYARLDGSEWLFRLFVRVSVGLMFFGGALKKLGDLPGLTEYFRTLGIPAPEIQAPFVAGTELLASALLMIGLLARPAAAALACIMLVALKTAGIPDHRITASWKGLLEFLYLADWLLLLLLGWVFFAGAGRASVDAWLARKRSP